MALDCCKKTIISLSIVSVIIIVPLVLQTWIKHRDHNIVNDRFANPSSLKFVAVLFRHGDRAPTFKYKTDPLEKAFPEGKGELTKKGKLHMYKKGQMFRSIYSCRGFLSDVYLDSEISIKTTHMGRTYMSAAMVLTGMYPPRSYQKWSNFETVWQPIPIYSDSPDHTPLLDVQGKCPLLDSIKKRLFSQFNYNTDKNITEPLLTYLSEKCGQPITIMDLNKLYDLFVCQMSDGLPLPEWIKPNHIETMKSIVLKKENLELFFGNPILQKLLVGPMIKEIGSAMELHSNNSNHNTTRKMHLYSGHDISILMMMGFLGNIIDMPDFGASLHLHLYLDKTIGYSVKVFYYNRWDSNKGEEFSITNCGNPCKIEDFINLVENSFAGDWEKECQKLES